MPRRDTLLLILLPVFVHLPELLGFVSSDPAALFAGLSSPPHSLIPGNPGWVDGNAGVTVQALGRLVAHDWRHLILPWWNPYTGVGMPLAGEYQPAAFFLPFVLLLGLNNGVLLLKLALQITAALGMSTLLKSLHLNRSAILTGAILYTFCGTFAWASDSPIQPIAFLPWLLWGVERAKTGHFLPFGLALGFMLLAGFPETAYFQGLLALTWAALRLRQFPNVRFLKALSLGTALGLGLAAPQLVAFLDYLPYANTGIHSGMIDVPLPHGGWAMELFPSINGPIFFASQYTLWFSMGGYLGLPTLILALAALPGKNERPLRILLGTILLCAFVKTANLPLFTQLLDLIPGLGHTLFFRYACSSWECAAIILAAFALNDIHQTPKSCLHAPIITSILILATLILDISTLHATFSQTQGKLYALTTLTAGLAALACMAIALQRHKPALAAWTTTAYSLAAFCFPLLSCYRPEPLDLTPIAYLHQIDPTQRTVSVGALSPNYGAYYGTALIDHNVNPAPKLWIAYLKTHIDPNIDVVTFDGSYPLRPDGSPVLRPALTNTLDAFQKLGVGTIIQGHGIPPFASSVGSTEAGGHPLSPGETATTDIPPITTHPILAANLRIGTYLGQSDGTLTATLCTATSCATAEHPLQNVPDNSYLPLNFSLPIPPNAPLHLTLTLSNATHPLMIWQVHSKAGTATPDLTFTTDQTPTLIMQTPMTDIYRIPNPTPYFTTTPNCILTSKTRTDITTTCSTPASLTRRELYMPGWQATLNDYPVPISPQDNLFQVIPLSRGTSHVHFNFAPIHVRWAWAGLTVAAILTAIGLIRRPQDASTSST